MKYLFATLFIGYFYVLYAQQDSVQQIRELYIQSYRIKTPFYKKSQTVTLVDSIWLRQQTTSTTDQILQNINGIDIRRRGIAGIQSDIYIRGGGFDQVLLMIDGFKMDDIQTGHHSMNGVVQPEIIEHIEVTKGAASRIYGQNAMNGVVNFVTKIPQKNSVSSHLNAGYYDTYGAGINFENVSDDSGILFNINRLQSQGYRYNTDFEYWNAFLKTNIRDYDIIATYSDRKFGSNGFYGKPLLYKEQYEETQTHFIGVKKQLNTKHWQSTVRTYWRHNKDMYLFLRNNPDYYRNMHLSNKLTLAFDTNHSSDFGQTGLGVEFTQSFLRSNNLGKHNRLGQTTFAEHKFQFLSSKLDITPGVSCSYLEDFGWFIYPGIDWGYQWHKNFRTYLSTGFTSRTPTYTDLYIKSSAETGNADLKPEKAFTAEVGYQLTYQKIMWQSVYFYRNTNHLIDWIMLTPSDTKWQAKNINTLITNGFETNFTLIFPGSTEDYHQLRIGYTYMHEQIDKENNWISRYQLNHFKHQITSGLVYQFPYQFSVNVQYRFNERTDKDVYQLLDVALQKKWKKCSIDIQFNNIFDVDYSETNLVPMPKFNIMTGFNYQFL